MGGIRGDENYINAGVNPAYQGSSLLKIHHAGFWYCRCSTHYDDGYLIIYNIFQISVIQDIQSYGQLKTLGTTRRRSKTN